MIKLCLDCMWSVNEEGFSWLLLCTHPRVVKEDANALSSSKRSMGPSCFSIRSQPWPFDKCGRKGKLWSPKGVL